MPTIAVHALAFILIIPLLLATKASAQTGPKIVLTSQNFGCPLVNLNGSQLIQTQPGPFVIFCLYPNNLLCGYSTDFGGGTKIPGCPAQGFLKCPGCQPQPLVGPSPLVCPVVGPGQALLTHGQTRRDSSIICEYGSSIKCAYTKNGQVIPSLLSNPNCPQAANHIPAAACPTATHPKPSCRPS